ncbi:MAG: ABC transporter ATP-binding protein [Chloroflexi bacterium]|nr:ABC transporter ATP-binding protein [Chloroflexota bacterium]
MGQPLLRVRALTLVYAGDARTPDLLTLDHLDFEVAEGTFLAVLGPSGCGKSTLLRVIAGLLPPTQGEVWLAGRRVDGPQPDIGFVFQDPSLLPWRTVLENLRLPLDLRGVPRPEADRRAREALRLMGLDGFAAMYPRDLSGGMAQRVALARALIHRPRLLLLDEPFAALDALTREQMWGELLRVWHRYRATVIMVTHSITEALFLADRVLVLSPRPARIRLDMPVPLPRPRHEAMRYTPEFGALVARIRHALGAKPTAPATGPGPTEAA